MSDSLLQISSPPKLIHVRGDLLDADFSGATVVTMYLLQAVNLRIRERLREQLRSGSRVISRSFDMGDWALESVVQTALGPASRRSPKLRPE